MRVTEAPTLFIASSSGAKKLAEALAQELNAGGEVQARPWVREEAFANNRQILTSLLEHAREKDFAVVILTGDEDLRLADGKTAAVPRANCVFELGLFIGAFGTPERCFLLSSLANDVLLDQLIDVGGQVYERLEVPDGLENEDLCQLTAKEKAGAILRMVRDLGPHHRRPRCAALRIEELLAAEADAAEVPRGCAILIKERELPENRLRFAAVVRENMKRAVNYLYLFGTEHENYPRIVTLVRSMILAGLVPEKLWDASDNLGEEARRTLLDGKSEDARKEIEKITPHLFVELVEAVGFDEFCIHKADRQSPRGYLKLDPDRYVPISSRSARERYEFEPYLARKSWPTNTIFDPERVHPGVHEGIRRQVCAQFPASLHEALLEACFGSATSNLRKAS